MASSTTCLKYILLLLNFLMFVGGVACIVLGLLLLLDKPRLNSLLDLDTGSGTTLEVITSSAIIVISVGGVTVIFSIIGCCGAGRTSKILLGVYIGLTLILAAVQLVGGGLATYYRTETETAMETWMMEQLTSRYDGRGDSTDEFSRALDFAHQEFRCCGLRNYSEYKDSATAWTERLSRMIPIGCCMLNRTEFYNNNLFVPLQVTCTTAPTTNNSYIDQGCFEPVSEYLMNQALYLILVSFLLVIAEIVCIVLSCIMMRTIKDNVQTWLSN